MLKFKKGDKIELVKYLDEGLYSVHGEHLAIGDVVTVTDVTDGYEFDGDTDESWCEEPVEAEFEFVQRKPGTLDKIKQIMKSDARKKASQMEARIQEIKDNQPVDKDKSVKRKLLVY